jgi:cobalt-zinc-cadmium efflux system membrane fusion protein
MMSEQKPSFPAAATRPRPVLSAFLHYTPTFVVMGALAGLALWGHSTGWTMPRFADLMGRHQQADKEDWCMEHNVPDSVCIACHPELAGANGTDWCKEHGVPESRCTVCHPEILTNGVAGDWCREHGVPESNCTLCHSEIAVLGLSADLEQKSPATAPASRAAAARDPRPAPDLSYALVVPTTFGKDPRTCQTHARKVQFASIDSIKKAGVKLAAVTEAPVTQTVAANGEIGYDRRLIAQVNARASGTAWRIAKDLGQPVKKGELLMLVESADVGRAKAELLQAAAAVHARAAAATRSQASTEAGFRTGADLQEAHAALKEAQVRLYNARQSLIALGLPLTAEQTSNPTEQALQLLGLPEGVASELNRDATSANLLPVFAPQDGIITARNVVQGESIESNKSLFTIIDTSKLWLTIDLPAEQAAQVRLGDLARFHTESDPSLSVTGKIDWINTAIDDQTRTLKVRAQVENPDGRLRANLFGRAEITIRQTPRAVVVPDQAVLWEGCCFVVFVRLSDTIFQTRKVRIGARADGMTEIMVGVLPGEVVASAGSHVLTSEILKSSLGAGCTDD